MDCISVTTELDRLNVQFEPVSLSEYKTLCPIHGDSTPSLYINVDKKLCHCKACDWRGDFVAYIAAVEKKSRADTYYELQKRYNLKVQKTIPAQRVDEAAREIWKYPDLVQELTKRGLNEGQIKEHKLGVERNRITIPIPDRDGFYVNFKKYLPGAPGDKKFSDEKGCGSELRLFPIEQARYEKLVICAGEIKAIAASKQLNILGIGAVSGTGGENRWSQALTDQIAGKEQVWICYDVDPAGESAAKALAIKLSAYVEWVGIVQLPLDKQKYPKGGVDDYVAMKGVIYPLLERTEKFVPDSMKEEELEEAREFENFVEVVKSENVGHRIRIECVVSTADVMPYSVPKESLVTCPNNLEWCPICPMSSLRPEHRIMKVPPESPEILNIIDSAQETQVTALKKIAKIPSLCKKCEFQPITYFNVEDVKVSENLDVTKGADEKSMLPAYIVTDRVNLNETYIMEGKLIPSPKDSQAVFLVSSLEKKDDTLSSFEVTDDMNLEFFRPRQWTPESLAERLDQLYLDLEANVTRIYERRLMHQIMDLTYHSPLFINFEGRKLKGWIETLVVGDSSQGKTETASNLQKHYGLGSSVSCKTASVPGLIGGLQQHKNRWFVTWGAMPIQDRGLLILEELKGLEKEVFAKLTDTRSTGKAEIVKIEKRATYSRVRLLALSNARSERAINTYNSGVDVIKELIGGLEDIRRFDAFYIVNKNDIKLEDVLSSNLETPHVHTAEKCRNLVLWGWTVKKTKFEDEKYLLQKSIEFGRKYSDDVPIYDRGSGRQKIARLAAALAVRTYSCLSPDEVYVRNCHVDYILRLLTSVYDSPSFGYNEYSKMQKELEVIPDPEVVIKEIRLLGTPKVFAEEILRQNGLTIEHLATFTGADAELAKQLFGLFLRNHCLRKAGQKEKTYYKTGAFVKLLKEALADNTFEDRRIYDQEKEELM